MYSESWRGAHSYFSPSARASSGVHSTPNSKQRNEDSGPKSESSPTIAGSNTSVSIAEQSSSPARNTTASAASVRRKPPLTGFSKARRMAASGCSKPHPSSPSGIMHDSTCVSSPV